MTPFAGRMILRALTRRPGRTAITIAAVALAVAALVVLAAVMVGVGDTMIRNWASLHAGHVQVAGIGPADMKVLHGMPGVRTVLERRAVPWKQFDNSQLLASAWAVRADAARRELAAAAHLTAGDFLKEPASAAIGQGLADLHKLKIHDRILAVFPPETSPRALFVTGIFRTGVDWLDNHTVYVRLPEATSLSRQADPAVEPDEAALFLDDPQAADALADRLRAILPGAEIKTWRQTAPEMAQLIGLERVSMDVVLLLAMLILALGVSNTAVLTVAQRTREIGILKAMGVTPRRIAAQVLGEMLLLSGLAAAAGMALGAGAAAAWSTVGLDLSAWTSSNRHFLVSSVIYPRVTWAWVLAPGGVAMACGVLAGLLPAWRAARIDVVQALRWI